MGNRDFIKEILERKGKVHFGRVCSHIRQIHAHICAFVL